MQIFPISPERYTPKLGFSRHFSGQQGCALYMENYGNMHANKKFHKIQKSPCTKGRVVIQHPYNNIKV